MNTNTHRLRRGLALAIAVSALAAPIASAAPIDQPVPGTAGDITLRPSGDRDEPYAASVTAAEPSTVSGDGFDWGDAGIGAAAMLALAAIGAGGALVVVRRPRHGHTVA
jgi:hypothetical protein